MAKYQNKTYSLVEFNEEYAIAKEKDATYEISSFRINAYAIFRYEDDLKIPIWQCYSYNEAIGFAQEDSKETDGKYKHYSIEGIGSNASLVVAKFAVTFFNDITKDYRKKIKDVQIDIDDNAKVLAARQSLKDDKENEDWSRKQKYFEDIDY